MQPILAVNVTQRTTNWRSVNWRQANKVVRQLRQRIFRATQEGKWKKVRSLQKLLMRSYSNILVSVRRVTQTNQGKNTPRVDKLVVKTPEARGILVDILTKYIPWKPLPTFRVYIPKSNGKQRPLGIPCLIDRCLQAVVKNALEPAWEAVFEGSSYGFRPGKSAHDAIGKIYIIGCPHRKNKWVVDADIKGCFDNIDHDFLMKAIGNFPARKLIHQWLKSGYMENGAFYDTMTGTPQGGIVSPLLANIALHGMEEALGVKYNNRGEIISQRTIIRYADDFVVFCESREDAQKSVDLLQRWMKYRGLSLSDEKTKIVHLKEGFDFLGFNIRHYQVTNTATGWKLLIKPSKESMQKIRDKLRQVWQQHKSQNVDALIGKLNPIIRGWANYFRIGVSFEAFSSLDNWMHHREKRYALRMHPNKTDEWRNQRYWGKLNEGREDCWVFGNVQSGNYLLKFRWTNIDRHVLVKGKSSPDDPSLKKYWQQRYKAKASELNASSQKIAKKQNYRCPVCSESLFNGEEIHTHHLIPRHQGGKDTYANLQLMHLFCHQILHAQR